MQISWQEVESVYDLETAWSSAQIIDTF